MNPEVNKTEAQTPKAETVRYSQTIRGVVVSDKMSKTRVIEIKSTKRHGLYHKSVLKNRKLMVHDEKNESRIGDVVQVVSTRPLSRHKSFRLEKVVTKRAAE